MAIASRVVNARVMPRLSTSVAATPTCSWRLRLRVRLHSYALDKRLAEGADPNSEPELALRARQLDAPEMRGKIADSIALILVRAQVGPAPTGLGAEVKPATEAVLASSADLRVLVKSLRDERTVATRGVAMARVLVADGCGPLYNAAAIEPLRYRVRMATFCLEQSTGETTPAPACWPPAFLDDRRSHE
jgi:hypothetical protein